MTVQEIVEKISEYIHQGKNLQAEEELYADDIISIEQDGYTVTGKQAVIAKTKTAFENVEEFYGGGVTLAYVGTDSFLLKIEGDVKRKNSERTKFEEFAYYEVKDGKIWREHFFMNPMGK